MNQIGTTEGIGINPKTKQMDLDANNERSYDVIHPLFGNTTMKVISKNPRNNIPVHVFYGFQLQQSKIDLLFSQYADNKKEQRVIANRSRDAVRTALKNPNSDQSSRIIIDFLVEHTVKTFNNKFPIDQYDAIISMPTSATLNTVLVNEFKKYAKRDVFISNDAFVKQLRKDVTINQDMIDREKSEKTKDALKKLLAAIQRSHPDKPFSIKKIPASYRRYFKFLKFTDPETQEIVKTYVENKKILLIDDTFGEFTTFGNAINNLTDFNPQSIDCFALLKDY